VFICRHSAKLFFAVCPRNCTRQTRCHTTNVEFPVVSNFPVCIALTKVVIIQFTIRHSSPFHRFMDPEFSPFFSPRGRSMQCSIQKVHSTLLFYILALWRTLCSLDRSIILLPTRVNFVLTLRILSNRHAWAPRYAGRAALRITHVLLLPRGALITDNGT